MHAHVARGRYNVGDEAKIQRAVDWLILENLKTAPGLRLYLGGFDHANRTLLAITLWDTAEQARAMDAQSSPLGTLVRFDPPGVFEVSSKLDDLGRDRLSQAM